MSLNQINFILLFMLLMYVMCLIIYYYYYDYLFLSMSSLINFYNFSLYTISTYLNLFHRTDSITHSLLHYIVAIVSKSSLYLHCILFLLRSYNFGWFEFFAFEFCGPFVNRLNHFDISKYYNMISYLNIVFCTKQCYLKLI